MGRIDASQFELGQTTAVVNGHNLAIRVITDKFTYKI